MAQKTIVRLVDDLDDTEIQNGGGQTVSFGLDGRGYEIDLTNEHADELRELFSRYVSAGRKVGGVRLALFRRSRPPRMITHRGGSRVGQVK